MSDDGSKKSELDEEAALRPTLPDLFTHTTIVEPDVPLSALEMICPRCLETFQGGKRRCPHDSHTLLVINREQDARVGEVILDRLTLLGLEGSGGMGTVYRALQHSMGREVAVKVLKRSFSTDRALVKRFMREARSASRLAHPNIITVFDFGQTSRGELYLVMELLKGRSLRQISELEGALPTERVLSLIGQLCDALTSAHEMGVIHCDIKPDNVFVLSGAGQSGEFIKVIDFGLAKVVRPDGTISNKDVRVDGTPAYMSPEQVMGQPVDRRTDIYSIGVLLYELLAGRLPFNKTQAARMLMAHVLEEPRPLREARQDPERPEGVDEVVMRALSKKPDDRPADAFELKKLLLRAWGARPSLVAKPRLRVSPAPPNREHNLPPDGSSFIGREADLSALETLLREQKRLVTIMGTAGMGKTRLSLRFASTRLTDSASHVWNGVWFCDLTEARSLDDICRVVAEVLEVPLIGGQTAEDSVGQLGIAIAARGRTVIILDNFEQVTSWAGQCVSEWLSAAPRVRFLVTSREILHVGHEVVYDLSPLGLPLSEGGEVPSDAEALFIERALAARPNWRPNEEDRKAVAKIVRGLDGVPLAIELAAARMNLLSTQTLLRRLEKQLDLLVETRSEPGSRRATLRAAIEWSWDLLVPSEQSALAQISVFRGGFTLEAAEEVIDLEGFDDCPWAGDILQSLREKSLLFVTEPTILGGDLRFGLYETIRRFSAEKLVALEGYEDTNARHCAFFLEQCKEWAAGVEGADGLKLLDLLTMERDNLLAIHRRSLGAKEPTAEQVTAALRAVLCLDPVLSTRGPFVTHIGLLDTALQQPSAEEVSVRVRARALHARGEAKRTRGLLAEASEDFESALALAREVGDRRTEGRVLWNLGVVADSEGELDEALGKLREALRVQRKVGDRIWEGRTIGVLGIIAFWQEHHEEAKNYIERALHILHEVGDRRFEGYFLGTLGAIHQEVGALNEARLQYERALAVLREVGGRRHEGMFLGYLGGLEWEQGRFGEARRRLGQALDISREVGDRRHIGLFLAMLSGIDATDDRFAQAAQGFDEAEVVLTEVGDISSQSVLELHRGHLDLALARRALVVGPHDEADSLHSAALRRISRAEDADTDAASLASRSDDVRFALRMLKRALDWQPKNLGAPE